MKQFWSFRSGAEETEAVASSAEGAHHSAGERQQWNSHRRLGHLSPTRCPLLASEMVSLGCPSNHASTEAILHLFQSTWTTWRTSEKTDLGQ